MTHLTCAILTSLSRGSYHCPHLRWRNKKRTWPRSQSVSARLNCNPMDLNWECFHIYIFIHWKITQRYRICSFEVHSSVFLLSSMLGNPHYLAHFHHSRKKPSHSSRHWQLLAFSALWRGPVWTFHVHGIIHCVAFHGWFPPQIMLLLAHPCCITCQDLLFLTDECISLCGQSSSYLAVHQLCFGIALGSSMNNSGWSPHKRLCESVFLVLLEST